MTLHITCDHQCPDCGALYIPYDANVPCPNCGQVEEDRFDYIPEAVDSALCNLQDGSYLPGVWWVGTYGDHVLSFVFTMLEQHRTCDDGSDFPSVARAFVDGAVWGNQAYGREHVFEIACRVYEEIQKHPVRDDRGLKLPHEESGRGVNDASNNGAVQLHLNV